MANVSKMVAGRIKISGTVQSSVEVHGAEIAQDLTSLLFPDGAPEQLTLEGFLAALNALLIRNTDALKAADLKHAEELADDASPRTDRDEGTANLRMRVISVRGTLEGLYGPEILPAYGMGDQTPTAPELLLQSAASIEGLLRKRPITETPRHGGVTIDRTALADDLAASAAVLNEQLGTVKREEREAQLTLNAKQEAVDRWSTSYQGVADTITGLCEIAGRQDLADRVRPTSRRRAGLPEKPDAPTPES